MGQRIITSENDFSGLAEWIRKVCRPMLVCRKSAERLKIYQYFDCNINYIRFSDFAPNPDYNSVVEGVRLFREQECDSMIALGGGSAIDVAKCIWLFQSVPSDGENGSFLGQETKSPLMPFLAIPTTAGTGSESTRFAVIYYKGEKQSITGNYLPDLVLLDCSTLATLPVYQRKATMMDVLSHAIESYWSVRSTDESKHYAAKAIKLFIEYKDGYLKNTEAGNAGMLLAANTAGKAINITQTTAGHAMCYKITTLFGCAHGHSAALCNRVLLAWMVENTEKCIDPRGKRYLEKTLDDLGKLLQGTDRFDGAVKLKHIIDGLCFDIPEANEKQFGILRRSVNPVRLKNNPVELNNDTIDMLYHIILREKHEC